MRYFILFASAFLASLGLVKKSEYLTSHDGETKITPLDISRSRSQCGKPT
jgi:hypothetical protein